MSLNRDNWPTVDRIRSDLKLRFPLPDIPASLDAWFAFARATTGMTLYPDVRLAEAIEYGGLSLDGRNVVDPDTALVAMEGYRFVLDQRNSSPERLIWTDQVDRGAWKAHWLVIESIEADPFIADIGSAEVPVLFARHGSGVWTPKPMFPSIIDFIASLRAEQPVQAVSEPVPRYSVVITDFGPEPKRVLLGLKRLPDFSAYPNAALLALTSQKTLTLLEDSVSRSLAERTAKHFRDCGASVDILTDRG